MGYSSPSSIYQQIEISSSNKFQLVSMLYDGAVRFISMAKSAIEHRDLVGKAQNLDRALAIIGELQNTLNVEEGGEIAHQLDRLYSYMIERILESSAKLEVQPLTEVTKLLRILNSAWVEVARKNSESSAIAPTVKSATNGQMPTSNELRQSMEFYG
jgi:flagellar protein FliS